MENLEGVMKANHAKNNPDKNSIIKNICLYLMIYFCTASLLAGILFATACIPNRWIQKNMVESAIYFSDKDPFEFTYGKKLAYVRDNYADAILLGVIWNVKDSSPVVSALDTKYYDGEENGISYGLFLDAQGDVAPNVDYTRYWHGSMVVIRPMLLFFTIDGIKKIAFGCICLLGMILCGGLICKKHYFAAGSFALAMLCIRFWTLIIAMEYQPMFLLGLIMCILFLLLEKRGTKWLIGLAIISGTATAFFDFLTTETVAILLPLLFVFLVREDEKRNASLKENLLLGGGCGIAWGMSYVMMFVTKWVLVSLATGENKITSAVKSAGVRMNGAIEDDISGVELFVKAIPANLTTLFGGTDRVEWTKMTIGLFVTVIVLGSVFYLFHAKKMGKEFSIPVMIIGVLPYVRYFVLCNHSYLHEFFTYRAQVISIMAVFGLIWYQCDFTLFRKKKRKGR